jgi:hypothetical protein
MANPTKRRSSATGASLRRAGPDGRAVREKNPAYAGTMKKPVPAPIELLFARHPALTGFSVRGLCDVPDNCARSGDAGELFVSDIGVSPTVSSEQFGEIFEEITSILSEFIAEQPGAGELLRGRTFARTLH